jgi:hypothetical protein
MSIGPLANLAGGYLQSIIGPALRGAEATTTSANAASGAAASQPDNGQLSPFAQLLNTLQQLQQSNPAQYQQVTQQISSNLQTASQSAQTGGNTTAAAQLSTLATDFQNASQSGQLPNVQDLAEAVGGGHHHHHAHAEAPPTDAQTAATGSASSASGSAPSLSQLSQILASFQNGGVSAADATNPLSIILNTLSSAGITGAGS